MADDERFNVVTTEIECPFNDGTKMKIEIGWVNPDYPMLHVNAPEVMQHLHEKHEHS